MYLVEVFQAFAVRHYVTEYAHFEDVYFLGNMCTKYFGYFMMDKRKVPKV
jgi:hypothetical protein